MSCLDFCDWAGNVAQALRQTDTNPGKEFKACAGRLVLPHVDVFNLEPPVICSCVYITVFPKIKDIISWWCWWWYIMVNIIYNYIIHLTPTSWECNGVPVVYERFLQRLVVSINSFFLWHLGFPHTSKSNGNAPKYCDSWALWCIHPSISSTPLPLCDDGDVIIKDEVIPRGPGELMEGWPETETGSGIALIFIDRAY